MVKEVLNHAWRSEFSLDPLNSALNFKAVLLFKGKFLCMGWNYCGFPCSATTVQNKNEELSILLRLFWGWGSLWTVLYQNTLVYILVNNFCMVASIPFCVHRNCSRSSQEPIQVHLIAIPWFSGLTIKLHLLWYPLKSQGRNSFGRVGWRNRGKSFCFGKQKSEVIDYGEKY